MITVPESCQPWIRQHRSNLKTTEDYAHAVQGEFSVMRKWLPAPLQAVLDIGGGLGGLLTVFMKEMDVRGYLMDETGHTEKPGGFQDYMGPNNDISLAQELFDANGVSPTIVEMDPEATLPVDLIISTYSWGFHYPLKSYEGLAERSLLPGGRVIADVRYDPRTMFEGFRKVGVLHDVSGGGKRTCWERI